MTWRDASGSSESLPRRRQSRLVTGKMNRHSNVLEA
jgi:hypothetical protein